MASYLNSTLFSLYLILTLTFFITINAIFSEQFVEPEGTHCVNKITHLHFYFHNIVSGKNPTVDIILRGKNNVGMTVMIDDPLTEGTEHGSKIVGRAQGMYASSPSKKDAALLMVVNFVLLEGKYNGSTVTILGWDPVLEMVREMSVIGGSGIFRFCRGYALAKTVGYNQNTGDAVVEYDVYARHS